MSYRPIPIQCPTCGETPARIEEVGLSGDRELVIHWWCAPCKRVMNNAIALTGCWELCPPPDVSPEMVERMDVRFLAALGIRY
jgi:hypothetical protein